MNQQRNRKYPRVYAKKTTGTEEKALTLSMATAMGIIILTFTGGALLGYMVRNALD